MKTLVMAVIVAVAALVADQAVKLYCKQKFLPNQFINVMGVQQIKLTRVMNHGVMFESMSQFPPGENKALTQYLPTALLAVFILAFLFLRGLQMGGPETVLLALFVGGSLSNIWDHWRSDFVMDTFGLWLPKVYLLFNLADVFVLTGWLGVGVYFYFGTRAVGVAPARVLQSQSQ